MLVGQKLKEQRLQQNETQESIAIKLGVSRQTISNWENGKTLPDIDSLIKLSQIYQLSIDELFDAATEPAVESTTESEAESISEPISESVPGSTSTSAAKRPKLLQTMIKRNVMVLFILLLIGLIVKYIASDFSQLKT